MEVPRGFTRCDECGGEGDLGGGVPEIGEPDPCPTCGGSGLVPTEELRKEAAEAARSMWGRAFADIADAVLRKVAEHLAEKERAQ